MDRWYTWPTTAFMSILIGGVIWVLVDPNAEAYSGAHWVGFLIGYPVWVVVRNRLFPRRPPGER